MVTLDYTVKLCLTKLKTKQTYKKEKEKQSRQGNQLWVCTVWLLLEKFLDTGVGVSLLVPQLLATGLLILKTEGG